MLSRLKKNVEEEKSNKKEEKMERRRERKREEVTSAERPIHVTCRHDL